MEKSHGKEMKTEDLIGRLEKGRMSKKIKAFEASDEKSFEEKMDSMALHQLQRMCVSVGCVPTGTKPFLKRKLRSEFKKALGKTNSIDKTINFKND